jgi:hypothetical protein
LQNKGADYLFLTGVAASQKEEYANNGDVIINRDSLVVIKLINL